MMGGSLQGGSTVFREGHGFNKYFAKVSISRLEDSGFYLMTVWDALMTLVILAEVLLSISEVW